MNLSDSRFSAWDPGIVSTCSALLNDSSPAAAALQPCPHRVKEPSLPQVWGWGSGSSWERGTWVIPWGASDHCPYLCWKPERDIEVPGSSLVPHASRTPASWMLTSSRFGWSRREKCSFGGAKIFSTERFSPALILHTTFLWCRERIVLEMTKKQRSHNQCFLCACGCCEFSMYLSISEPYLTGFSGNLVRLSTQPSSLAGWAVPKRHLTKQVPKAFLLKQDKIFLCLVSKQKCQLRFSSTEMFLFLSFLVLYFCRYYHQVVSCAALSTCLVMLNNVLPFRPWAAFQVSNI